MLLAIDIGNTNTVLGVFLGETLEHQWRISTRGDQTADEVAVTLRGLFQSSGVDPARVADVAVSSVVPPLNEAVVEMCRRYLGIEPLVVGPGVRTGVQIRYDNPREVGADRIVNGLAAFRKYGGPAVVIDFGTATTFDAIAVNGDYLGGAICPGIRISMDALFARAAKLPRVEMKQPQDGAVIGKNTVDSMQAGFLYGFVGQIEGIVQRMRAELGEGCKVIATGGLATLIAAHASCIEVVDDRLTLDGLRLLHELNRGD
ncbi:MAG TPA: type III pantothenate kinase [Candidatus Dormibacteraeota bacterium]|jgi:type III pantothenate kinase|nr:type III pantothenate kinase [Candidatus Dormibacteraeota bacterium]